VILYLFYLADVFLSDLLAFPEEVIGIHFLLIVVVIYTMGYMGLRQPAIFSQQPQSKPDPVNPIPETLPPQESPNQANLDQSGSQPKYQRSALDRETSQLLYQELQNHMDEQRVFLDSKLTLPQLAGQLGITPNYLSQVINEQAECNFFDFINRYRVAEAQTRLTSQTGQVNILATALDAGFNSKSAFYSAFKRHTGQTPSQYRTTANTPITSQQPYD
jgi:AraC-like DNA-binding protein